jgi:hypothetical protein
MTLKMTDEEIRAKSLEIAAITLGAFPNNDEKQEIDHIPEVYLKRAKNIEAYIRGKN